MRKALAIVGLLLVLAGVPAVLLALSGAPDVPSFAGVSLSDDYLPPELVLDVLAFVTWIAWAYLALAALLRMIAVVAFPAETRTQRALLAASLVLAPSPLRRLVDVAIGGALIAATFSPRNTAVTPARPPATTAALRPDAPPVEEGPAKRPHTATYRVRPGDSLWRIAEEKLGSGFRWREIYELNRGRTFQDGRSLDNPRLIHPGWKLALPVSTSAASEPQRKQPIASSTAPTAVGNGGTTRTSVSASDAPRPSSAPDRFHQAEDPAPPNPPPALRLPSGATVALSFASGLLTAQLLGRLRRRRSHRPLQDQQDFSTTATEAHLVREIQRAGATPGSAKLLEAVDATRAAWRANHVRAPVILAAVEHLEHLEFVLGDDSSIPENSGGSVSPRVQFRRRGEVTLAEVRGPFRGPADRDHAPLEAGLLVPVGHSPEGSATHIGLLGTAGLSVEGTAGPEAAAQMMIGLAAGASPDDLRIVLLGEAELGLEALPHVIAACGWSDAEPVLRDLQVEFLRRARLLFEEGAEDIWAHIEASPDDRLPGIVIVSGAPPAPLSSAVEALGREAPLLGGAVVALGWRFPGATVRVQADDAIALETDLPIARRLRAFQLAADDAKEALAVIREAWAEPSQEPASAADHESPAAARPQETEEPQPDLGNATPTTLHPVPPRPAQASDPPLPGSRLEIVRPLPPADTATVECLGSFHVKRGGRLVEKGWRTRAREMLAYLVAYPDGVPKDRLIELLWPEENLDRANREFDRAVHFIRRDARGPDDTRHYVDKTLDSWRLVADQWWVDAWEMLRIIEEAQRQTEPAGKTERLKTAIAHYRGEFCDDCYFPWAEPVRERFRNAFLRACAQFAELLADSEDFRQAIDVLDLALAQDPLCEDLARLAIRIEASAGRALAAERRYDALADTLRTELKVEPDPETQALMRQISRTPAHAGAV